MFTIRRPTNEQMRAYLARQADQPLSYDAVGCTREELPRMPRWNVDRNRVLLGHGREVFEAAKRAINRWEMFPRELAQICHSDQPPRQDLVVGVLYKAWLMPLWILFPARVVWMVDDSGGDSPLTSGPSPARGEGRIQRCGFAYGTLPDHPERGEERFVVEWNENDDSVWYDLLAVSRPAHWLARVGYPYTRYEQARFRRLSGEAMRKAVR
jgi:uncharacterized protein (UPF0548 family)